MNISDSDKVTVLLHLLDTQQDAVRYKAQHIQQLFEWGTNLLLVSFGAVIALSQRQNPLPNVVLTKSLASALISIPTLLIVYKIISRRTHPVKNADAIERIHNLLHLYSDSFYGNKSPYPKSWENNFAKSARNRQSPLYYSGILMFMVICVIVTIWLAL